jgi:cell division protein FtsW (lipid II flippase)
VPYLFPVALACLLMVVEPDLGTAIVVCLATGAMLVAAGVKLRHLMLRGRDRGGAAAAIVIEPYRMQRLTGFIHPNGDPAAPASRRSRRRSRLARVGSSASASARACRRPSTSPRRTRT